jgi:hypothetical protein
MTMAEGTRVFMQADDLGKDIQAEHVSLPNKETGRKYVFQPHQKS